MCVNVAQGGVAVVFRGGSQHRATRGDNLATAHRQAIDQVFHTPFSVASDRNLFEGNELCIRRQGFIDRDRAKHYYCY